MAGMRAVQISLEDCVEDMRVVLRKRRGGMRIRCWSSLGKGV